MKKTIIFDLDGTLINSDPVTMSLINEIRKEEGFTPLSRNLIRPYLAMGGLTLIQNTISNTNSKSKNTEYLERLRYKISQWKTEEDLLFPNVKFALRKLAKNNINLCICTNKGSVIANKILSELEVTAYFKNVIADGDLDTRKPHENNFFACMRGLNSVKSECLIIGDSQVDLELAENAGVDFLAFDNQENSNFIENFSGQAFKCYRHLVDSVLIG